MKPIFCYLASAPLPEKELRKIRAAGYAAVAVHDFESVRILDPSLVAASNEIAKAAYATIAQSGYSSTRDAFGTKVAALLAK